MDCCGLPQCDALFQRVCRLRDEGLEALGVVNGDLGEHLAVERDACLRKAFDEPAVGRAVLAGRRIDAGDPERAELALLQLAMLGGHDHGALDGGRSLGVGLAPVAVKAFRGFQHLFVAPTGCGRGGCP